MSLVLRIGTQTLFDGTTVVDLSGAVQNPANRRFEVSFPVVGLIPLWTFAPLGARDVWLQTANSPDVIGLAMVFPSGVGTTLSLGSLLPNVFNVVVPQGAMLLVTSLVTTTISLWLHGMNDKTYPDLACCHQFNPKLEVQPPPP